jgi:enoyl-CoA hydratase/carnithine racemase
VAKDLIFTGRQVSASEARDIGLVDRLSEPGAVLDDALAWARELASGPSAAIAGAKAAIDGGLDGSLADGLVLEQKLFVEVFGTEDAATGVASFLEHGPGKATFAGR